jgi:hypothetical protein
MAYYLLHTGGVVERFDDRVSIYDIIEEYNMKFGREATEVDDTIQYTINANNIDLVFVMHSDNAGGSDSEYNRAMAIYFPESRVVGPVYVACFPEDEVDACIEFNIDYLYNFKLCGNSEQFELIENE